MGVDSNRPRALPSSYPRSSGPGSIAPASYRVITAYDFAMENRPLRRSVAPSKGIGFKSIAFFAFISLSVAGASLGALKYSGLEAQAAQPPTSTPAAPPKAADPALPPPAKPTALVVGDVPPATPTVIELDEPNAAAKPGLKAKAAPAPPKRVAPVRRPAVNPRTGLPVTRGPAPPAAPAAAEPPAAPVTAPPPPNPYEEGSPADGRL